MHRALFLIFIGAASAGIALVPTSSSAQQVDVIRGRVTDSDSAAVENVTVTVTSISGNVSRTARTDANGRFTVTFPGGDGDYIVSFAALGYAARRFEVKRVADEDILIADTRLTRVGTVLDPVEVTAQRERVPRNAPTPDVGGTEQTLSNAAVPANLMGDLAAMAATLPGVQAATGADGSDGFSVLGLGADQNNATLDGMQFGGSSLPRDASVATSLVTAPYDVSRGGFSGAQMTLRTRPGSNFITRGMSLNLDAPQLQWTDRAGRSLGQEYSNRSLGGMLSGPIAFNKSFYSVAYQLGRRSSDLQTLLNTDAAGLQAAGVSRDSVERLIAILGGAGIPLTLPNGGSSRAVDQGSVFGSFDFAPPTSSTGQALNLSFNGGWNRQSPAFSLPTELPSHGGERSSVRGGLQARHSSYLRSVVLTETSLGLSASRTETAPFLRMPAGQVRVTSLFPDGASGVQNLRVGGNQSLNNTQDGFSAAFMNQLSWFSSNNKHRLKLTTELRGESASQEQSSNLLGTFAYNSLADLEAGRPASFSRQLNPRLREVRQLLGAVSLGDSYRRSAGLQFQYGVRLDANRYLGEPDFNSELEQRLGLRNGELPSRLYVSPRVGFSWTYGTGSQIAGFEGAARGPRAVIRGGIGVFQNSPSLNLVGAALDNTGLPGAAGQLSCVGAATPRPDWMLYAFDPSAIPTSCADGSSGSVFANASPNVTLFAPDYAAPRSVRSNLQWSGPIAGNRFSAQIDGTYSLNLNQPGSIDRNFSATSPFVLSDEAGRPVFVQPTSIVPGTGAIASRDARVSPLFSRVTELSSDLRSESRQLSARISPVRFSTTFGWSLSYVYSNVREQSRGFSSTTGNPYDIEWSRSSLDSRHQLVYNLTYNFFDFVRASWFGAFRSGVPFTPMVAGDINGDGYNNDRAFVIDPTSASDPQLAAGMSTLLEQGSDAARSCLARQLGQLAARNSCQGPWTSNASLSISFNPVKVRMPQRATLSLQLSNPLGAADLLLHGTGNLRGWGQPSFPEQSLLYVKGFDPQTLRYRYEVNQRFGSTNQATAGFRVPVTLTAMLRFDLGPTRERQILTQQLDRGRRYDGDRAPEMLLRAMYSNGGIANPMATILRQQDTLKLTAQQADSIAVMNRAYTIQLDRIWSPVIQYLSQLPDTYDNDAAYGRYLGARKATVDLLIRTVPAVRELLSAEQRRKLPAFIASHLEPRYLASIRSGTAAFTAGSSFGGSSATALAGAVAGFAPGGGTMTIIRH